MSETVTPRVSVLVVTYNHERHIRQALDSVTMQDVDFAIEIVIADDHSQDATLSIVEEYGSRFRHLRVLPPLGRNVGITRNYQRGFSACRGQYVAVLEGDDYWTSPVKLKTLVDFLDAHPECVVCFHRFLRHDEASDTFTLHPQLELVAEDFAGLTAAQLARRNFIGNFSVCMYRREALDRLDPALFELKAYDWIVNIAVARQGRIGYVPALMSVYRAHAAGAWSGKRPDEWRPELLGLVDTYDEHLGFRFSAEFQAYKAALLAETRPASHDAGTPKVSVLLVTSNQERYLRQALEGVFMQRTDFDFEVVVADDRSEDSTLAIVREYQARYPGVRVLPSEEKVGETLNYQRGFAACRGKYVAVIEGDDCWISRNTLQVASMFLDAHPEYSFCFHRSIRHDERADSAAAYPRSSRESDSRVFTARELAADDFIGGASTCMYRSEAIASLDPGIWTMKAHEWMFNIAVAEQGSIGYIPEIMSMCRVPPGGVWCSKALPEKASELLALVDSYNEYLDFRFDVEFQACKQRVLRQAELPASTASTASAEPGVGGGVSGSRAAGRWIDAVMPPALVELARRVYSRARRPV